jgi:peptidoglycan/LPS O-acetylase OafA/YrhL
LSASASSRSADSHEIRPLTGIRGFAAALVVLFHFEGGWSAIWPALHVLDGPASIGYLGVDLFFLLSGFIISYVYQAGETAFSLRSHARFLGFRLARLYPGYLASLLFFALLLLFAKLGHVAISNHYPLEWLPTQLLLLQNWPFIQSGNWNYPAWSVSAEWFAYACIYPLCTLCLRRPFGEKVFLAACYSVLAIRLLVSSTLPPAAQVTCEFLAGSLLFGAYRSDGGIVRFSQRNASLLALLLLLVLFFPQRLGGQAPGLVVLLIPLLLVALASPDSLVAKGLSTAPALWLGKISYALYLCHGVCQRVIKIVAPAERFAGSSFPIRFGYLAANAGLLVLAAAALYYFVEKPSRNLLRRQIVERFPTRSPDRAG